MMGITFTKLFSSITESTVWMQPDQVRIVWITMLAMADRHGRVFASVPGLAHRARVDVADAEKAIAVFMAPDGHSRTKEFKGRRIEEIDGGWRLLTYEKHRALRDEEAIREAKRDYARRMRATAKKTSTVSTVDRGRAKQRQKAEGRGRRKRQKVDLRERRKGESEGEPSLSKASSENEDAFDDRPETDSPPLTAYRDDEATGGLDDVPLDDDPPDVPPGYVLDEEVTALVDLWNETRSTHQIDLAKIGKSVKRQIRERLKEVPDLLRWEAAFQRIEEGCHAMRETATLSWVTKSDAQLTYIEEGKYDENFVPLGEW